MGVHNKAAYIEIHKLLAIPPEEPIFILRAQDKHSIPTLYFYHHLIAQRTGDQKFADDVSQCALEFTRFQNNHPDSVKEPD